MQKKSSVAKGLRFRDYLVAFVRRICFNARVSFLRIYVSRLCEYFSYIFHIFHESPWTITSRSRTLENIRIHRKTCKIRKKYSRFLFVQYSRKNPRFSGKNFAPSIVAEQAPLHQTGRERLHLATSHRYYTRRGELDVAGFPSN